MEIVNSTGTILDLERELQHQRYNRLFYSDIAIITIFEPLKFELTQKVTPICLPYNIYFTLDLIKKSDIAMSGKNFNQFNHKITY